MLLSIIMMPAFDLFNCISIASAFGDQSTEAKLREDVDDWAAGLGKRLLDFRRAVSQCNTAA